MRFALLLLLLLATPAWAEDLSGNVLVWQDATFYTDANPDAATLQVAKLDAPRGNRVGSVVAMHVLSTKGDFVEVEPLEGRDCTWSQLVTNDDLAKLRLFVRRADLARVLTKPYNKTFADGSKLTLRPGTPVLATDKGRYAVSLRGQVVYTEITSSATGFSYMPDRSRATAMAMQEWVLAPNTPVKLGDQTLTPAHWRAAAIEKRGAQTVFTVEDRCTSLQVTVPASAVKEASDDDASISFGSAGRGLLELRDEAFIPPKTPLTIKGRQVAVAAKPIYLPARATTKNVCFERRVRLETEILQPNIDDVDSTLRLCAPATRVAYERMRSARSAHGSTSR